jgi:hypothetical protein
MLRKLWIAGVIAAGFVGSAGAFDDFYYDDGGWDDGGWDNGGGWNDGTYGWQNGRQYRQAPFTPGAQNNNSRGWSNPFSPGAQNNNFGWDNGNQWNNGYNNNWNYQQPQYQQNWQYQQPQYVQPQVVYSQQPIKLSMPGGEAGLCAYVLSSGGQSWNYTISPGKSQLFTEDRAWKVTYDRGNGYGEQSYVLKPGHYRFRQSSRGWELYRSDSMEDAPLSQAPLPPM